MTDAAAPHETHGPRPDDDRAWWRAVVSRVLDDCGAHALDRELRIERER